MDYNSKYTGEQVEELLDKINGSPEDIAIPTGDYPDMTVGKASQADTATRAINADNATKAVSADKATTADYATTAGHATTAGSATHADKATKADFATDLSGRNEATAEEFTLRPSAGNKSIRDDSATIKRIKGNSIVWNQMCDFTNGVFTFGESSGIKDAEGYTITANESNTTKTIFQFNSPIPFYSHKWLAIATIKSPIKVNIKGMSTQGFVPNTKCDIYSFFQSSEGNWYWGLTIESIGTISEIKVYNYLLFDLTQMFGAGNEPDTVEEFRALFPGNHYEYNPGQLVSMTANGLFTNGFNQWDEEWESGVYRYWSDGLKSDNSEYIRSTNFIKVIPANTYCLNIAQGIDTGVGFYDENNNFLGQASYSYSNNYRIFQVPANCQKITFYTKATTYNNNICINLSHTGVENGKYEPYWDATKDLSIIQKYFPNGMRSAGSIYDEISFDETTQKWVAIQRVGAVDLGELEWIKDDRPNSTITWRFKTGIINNANQSGVILNILSSKYTTDISPIGQENVDDTIIIYNGRIYIEDTSYTDAAAFKSALAGVILNYELAEPIITVIEEPVNLSYKVGDFGIEQILSDSFSAPFRADIIYQFNATDRIRENSLNIEKLSKTQKDYLPLPGGTMSGQINSQDIKPVEDNTYQLGDSTHKYDNVFSNFFTGNLEGNAKTATVATDLSGRVEATPEVFTYRPSAGEKSIKDDNAFIRRVKGNSVVWNQLFSPKKTDVSFVQDGITFTDNRDGSYTINGTATADITKYNLFSGAANTEHLYFVHLPYRFSAIGYGESHTAITSPTSNNLLGTNIGMLYVKKGDVFDNVTVYPLLTDLTQMFGVGNEPTTVEEFRTLYPGSYYPYNAGELRNLDCYGIKTVGFNLFDEDVMTSWSGITKDNRGWYGNTKSFYQDSSNNRNKLWVNTMGYTGQICVYIKSTAVDTQTNFRPEIHYIDGTTNSYDDSVVLSKEKTSAEGYIVSDENKVVDFVCFTHGGSGYVIVNNFCINLHHTGWRDGDYEPYKEVTHSLPLSQITNGEPLRKAGDVYDEINETEYIKRVGVVDLGSYDWHETPNGTFSTVVNIPDIKAVELESNYTCKKYIGVGDPSKIFTGTADNLTISTSAKGRIYIRDDAYKTGTAYAAVPALKASLSGVLLHYELAEPIITPIETPIDFNYYVEDFGTEEALLAEDSAPFSADIVYQFNATDQIRNNSRNIDKLQKSAFTPRGTSAQYIRGDGSYGDRFELSQSTPINDGEYEMPDAIHQFILTPNYYAKSPVNLDNSTTVTVCVTPPEDSNYLAEYWFEFAVDETLPNIEYYQPNNSKAVFRIDGDMMTYAVNILHLISSDGGNTFFGEIKNYSL